MNLFTRTVEKRAGRAYRVDGQNNLLAIDRVSDKITTDDKVMAATAVISTPSIDRDGDMVVQEGLDFTNYRRNPVVFFNHQAWPVPIGKSEDQQGRSTIIVTPEQTTATCYFSSKSKESEQIYHLVADGTLRSTSIGFLVKRATPLTSSPMLGMGRMSQTGKPGGYRIENAEVTEWSWVGIGANPEAVLVHLSKGMIAGSQIDDRLRLALQPYAAMRKTIVQSGWDAKAFDSSKHPRGGDPDNAGRFSTSSGSKKPDVKPGDSASDQAKPVQVVDSNPTEFLEERNKSERSQFLSQISAEDLESHRLYLSDDKKIGVALSPEGDIQNVFNNGGRSGGAKALLMHAMDNGGVTLDCFANFLPGYYACFGFEETGRMKFNREYAPKGWDYDSMGEPDVVFMARTKEYNSDEIDENLKKFFKTGKAQPEGKGDYYEPDQWDRAKEDSRSAGIGSDSVSGGRKKYVAQGRTGVCASDDSGSWAGRIRSVRQGLTFDWNAPKAKMLERFGAAVKSFLPEYDEYVVKEFREEDHPRNPSGSEHGGQFTAKPETAAQAKPDSGDKPKKERKYKPVRGATPEQADADPSKRVFDHQKGVPDENMHGFWPKLLNKAKLSKKEKEQWSKAKITATTNNKNAGKLLDALDEVLANHPDALDSVENYNRMQAEAFGSDIVPIAPFKLIDDLQGSGIEDTLKLLSDKQIDQASHGFENAGEYRELYKSGNAQIETTGELLLWSILSRGVSPYTQESLFIDAYDGAGDWIRKAAAGELKREEIFDKKLFDDEGKPIMVPVLDAKGRPAIDKKTGKPKMRQAVEESEYTKWAKSVAPKGSGQPGAGATHNLGAFGKNLLWKMSQKGEDGVSHLQRLHNLMSDPNQTGKSIRREFMRFGEGVGIDNKVVSFTLLVAGFDDVMVLDRVQMKNMFDDGRFEDYNLYDGIKDNRKKEEKDKGPKFDAKTGEKDIGAYTGSAINSIGNGVRGLLMYEACERALEKKIKEAYKAVGREKDASVGRYHWESWVASSQQEASHGTLGAILDKAKGEEKAIANVAATQGEYGAYQYGARYGIDKDGNKYIGWQGPKVGNDNPDGFKFTLPEWTEFQEKIKGSAVIKKDKLGKVPVKDKEGKQVYETMKIRVPKKDKDGNPVLDAKGKPVYRKDKDGKPLYKLEPKLDAKGNKIPKMKTETFKVTERDSLPKELKNAPWYERPEVNRERLVQIAASIAGKRAGASSENASREKWLRGTSHGGGAYAGWSNLRGQRPAGRFRIEKRCWEGYEPVPGKKPYSEDSCRPKDAGMDINEEIEKSGLQECVSAKIPKLIDEGYPQDQAVAIAYDMCRRGKAELDESTMEQKAVSMASADALVPFPGQDDEETKSMNTMGNAQGGKPMPPGMAYAQAAKELMEAAFEMQENPAVKEYIMRQYGDLKRMCSKAYPECDLEWKLETPEGDDKPMENDDYETKGEDKEHAEPDGDEGMNPSKPPDGDGDEEKGAYEKTQGKDEESEMDDEEDSESDEEDEEDEEEDKAYKSLLESLNKLVDNFSGMQKEFDRMTGKVK